MYSPDPKSTITSTGSIRKKAQVKLKRSTANRGALSENRYQLLCAAVRGNVNHSPQVDEFIKQNLSFLYSGSCKRNPNFTYDEENHALYRLSSGKRKEVVHGRRAREIIQQLHHPSGRTCRKDGINGLINRTYPEGKSHSSRYLATYTSYDCKKILLKYKCYNHADQHINYL